jgi:uncharacterized protein (DUF1800 family)
MTDRSRDLRGRSVSAAAAAVLALLGGAGPLGAATSFQFAYLYGTSGPASGGTAINVVGNQFQPGATVAVGGSFASASVTSSTRIGATMPALSAGTLHDVTVANPGGASSTVPKGWFADFLDVPQSSPFHAPVETIVRDGITSGCGGGNYCPTSSITRAQMAVFLLRAGHGASYIPPPATGTVFSDVAASDFAANWIEQLYAEGITGGCATNPLRYCPGSAVTRGQMAVFLLKVYHGVSYAPPPAQGIFGDVSVSSPLAPWIEEFARLAITTGCGGTSYCPGNSVTRGQMAVFMAKTFHRPEAVRFLEQATWGPTDAEIGKLLGMGYLPWLASQFSAPASSYPQLTLWPDSTPGSCDDACYRDNYSMYPLQTRFYRNAFYGPDQLRQRVAWALHKLIVVSADVIYLPAWIAPYLRTLDQQAFGNYRDLLWNVTLNPGMGEFLNMSTSTKYDPNENYAREILQLFSIGTEKLNQDGTTQNDVGTGLPLPTYDQSVIDQFKRVYTGWYIEEIPCPAPNGAETCYDFILPMSYDSDSHDTDVKTLFEGFVASPTVLPAGQTGVEDLNGALDAIFHHANVGPYLSRELIHSLVTSNPSPAYVERVAGFFNDNGAGVRGSLWAMVKAILLDPEARTPSTDPVYGKLREPVLYMNALLRAFNVLGENRIAQSDGHVSWLASEMGQRLLRPPSVFSYFPQLYAAPPASAGILGPEFGIMNANTALRRANFVNQFTFWGGINADPDDDSPAGTTIDLSELELLASSPANLVDRLNRLMLHGRMSDELKSSIIGAVNAVDPADPHRRAQQALYLVGVSSQYQIQR